MKTLQKRILGFILSLTTIFSLIPSQLFVAQASTSATSFANGHEVTDKQYLKTSSKPYILDLSKIANATEVYEDFRPINSWNNMKLAVEDMVKDGSLLGMMYKDKPMVPTTHSAKSADGAETQFLISGKESLGLSLFYFYGSTHRSSGFKSYGNTTRQSAYSNAFQNYYKANNLGTYTTDNGYEPPKDTLENTSTAPQLTRGELYLICAIAAEQYSGKQVRLSDYSKSRFGYMADYTTLVSNYTKSGLLDGKGVLDVGEFNSKYSGTPIMQAANLLVDVGAMLGRLGNTSTTVTLSADSPVFYDELYELLYRIKKNASKYEPTPYSKVDAALTMTASSKPISYKDFLDNGKAVKMTVTLDSRKTYSGLTVDNYQYNVTDSYKTSKGKNEEETSASKTYTFTYDQSKVDTNKITNNKGDATYDVKYTGSVKVTDVKGTSDTATASCTGKIEVTNAKPTAGCVVGTEGGCFGQPPFVFALKMRSKHIQRPVAKGIPPCLREALQAL